MAGCSSLPDGIPNKKRKFNKEKPEPARAAKNEDRFSKLPDHVKLQIFSYLSHQEVMESVAPVCMDWKRLSDYPTLWRRVVLNWSSRMPALEEITGMLRGKGYMKELAIQGLPMNEGGRHVYNDILDAAADNCPKLEKLQLTDLLILQVPLEHITLKCPMLREVIFCNCNIIGSRTKNVIDIFAPCAKLEKLHLCDYDYDDIDVDNTLVRQHQNLKEFRQTKYQSFQHAEVVMRSSASHLRVLEISSHLILPQSFSLLQECHEVVELRINYAYRDTIERLTEMLGGLPNLRSLHIKAPSFCPLTTEDVIVSLLNHPVSSRLESFSMINFDRFQGDALDAVAMNCHCLTELDLRKCGKVKDYMDSFEKILTGCKNLKVMKLDTDQCVEDSVNIVTDKVREIRPDIILSED